MTRLLIDVNVVLDVLLERTSHLHESSAIWKVVESKKATGLLAAHAVTTIYYLYRKQSHSEETATHTISALLGVFEVASVDQAVVQRALQLSFGDFEDAITAAAAEKANCHFIVTRNSKDFRKSPVKALTPEAATYLVSTV